MTTMDIDALRALLLVADLKSFTRTAEALGTTQPVVSLRLKRLEGRLGRCRRQFQGGISRLRGVTCATR